MEFFLASHVTFELIEVVVVANVEGKGHCRIDFCVVDLLCLLLVVLDVVLFD